MLVNQSYHGVLAVNRRPAGFRGINGHLPARRGSPPFIPRSLVRRLTAARAVMSHARAIPPKNSPEDPIMNGSPDLAFDSYANAFCQPMSLETVRECAPAVFAPSADEHRSAKYTFIPTERVLNGLMQAGFVPVYARQCRTRSASPLHARHVVRLRRRFETVQLRDSQPELVFLNSHDGTSAYQLRMGLFRVVCTNGLIVSRGAFPTYSVSHRGNIVEDVVAHALSISERFNDLAAQVERMEQRHLYKDEQLQFAQRALALRYPDPGQAGMGPSQLAELPPDRGSRGRPLQHLQ